MSVFNTEFYTHVDVKKFTGHKDEVNCMAFSTDFEILITGSDDERTRVFNTNTGKLVVRLKGQYGAIRCVAISPDSQYIASGSYDKSVILYRTCTAETIHRLTAHLKSVESVVFSPCSALMCSTSWDRTGILWQVESGHMLRIFQGHASLVQCAAFSPCKRMLATGSWDHTVRIWPLNRSIGEHIQELTAHISNIHAVAFSRHNLLATGSWDKKVILWNPYKAEILYTYSGHEGWVQALCFSADGYMLVSSADDDMVKIWDVTDGKCLKTLEGKTESAAHCGFHPSGALVASGSAVTTLVLADSKPITSQGRNSPAPPHILKGEEILDRPASVCVSKPRAQSARPSRKASLCGDNASENSIGKPVRPGTAIRQDEALERITNVERWLSSSFQRL